MVLACISVLNWGSLTSLYASGDLFPYTVLDPGRWIPAAMQVWSGSFNVGGNLPYNGGYLLSSTLEWLPRTLGVPPAWLQRGEFALVIAGTLLSAYALPAELGITASILPRLIGSITFVFSLTLLMHTGDILVATVFLTVVLLPVTYGRYLRTNGFSTLALGTGFVIASQLMGYVYINPPQAVIVTVQVTLVSLCLLLRRSDKKRAALKTAPLLLATLAASAWWIVPAYAVTFNPALHIIAVTNVTDWAWTQVQSSFLNTWRLIPYWGWAHQEFFPWNAFYDPRLVQITQLWPFLVVNLTLLATRRKTGLGSGAVLVWGAATVVVAFLVKGIHPPLTAANFLLYDHVPGFFLFREPATKFSEPLVFAATMLLVLLLTRAEQTRWRSRPVWPGVTVLTAAVVGVLAWPGFSGMVTQPPPQTSATPSAPMIAIPAYWYQMAAYLSQRPDDDGYALLPNDDYYAQQYDWGFYGTDQLPASLIRRPALYLYDTPQTYTSASTALDDLVEQIVVGLHQGQSEELARQLGIFGVRYLLLRHDITSADIAGRHVVPPVQLAAMFERTPNVQLVHKVGALDLYEVRSSLVRPRVFGVAAGATRASQTVTLATLTSAAASGVTLVSAPPPSCAPPVPSGESPNVTILSQDLEGYTVQITTNQTPVLLVLNQSFNPGWLATIQRRGDEERTCAGPLHVTANGYANGWWITEPGTTVVRLVFTPQRVANAGLLLSGLLLAGAALTLVAFACASCRRLIRGREGKAGERV